MNYLENVPPYLFFTGKGGVGKTSHACASALALAESGKKVLIVSTDPASNVGQVFDTEIGEYITAINHVENLFGMEIDPQAAAQNYRERIVGPIRGKLPDLIVKNIEEQLSGACTTEVAAFDEFTSLLTDESLQSDFDHIVFDTAPTGHTIRLLQLPGAWNEFLEHGQGDASCLGPLAGLEKQRVKYANAIAVLSDESKTRLILVARAQSATIKEAAKTHIELSDLGLKGQHLVLNGLFPVAESSDDELALAIIEREQKIIEDLPWSLAKLPLTQIPLLSSNVVGLDSLRALLEAQPIVTRSVNSTAINVDKYDSLSVMIDELAKQKHGLIMLMGKGGVGKTTMAAAIASKLAEQGLDVHLTTSDPAAHLQFTLNSEDTKFTVSKIDPAAETTRYREAILKEKGASLDEDGRKLLEEDLRSPCTEEIAVFQAFSEVIKQADKKFVIMDTAPTGHTLLLLDATGAYHKEMTRQNQNVATPLVMLQNSDVTKVIITTLAEPTPVQEAYDLQQDLQRANINPWGWIINNSLVQSDINAPLLKERAASQQPLIDKVINEYSSRTAVVALQKKEPVGVLALNALSDS
ncbi:arsenical pump-driving ATPase [Aliivibrio fischeri]|nr:arsenical pump-driving ATPase [Aliivibrio fischeri]MCE4936512.1 arsenical pump-driving ATPase [Aliivibrio fischeri]MUH95668.1 arsenical pump-driving ATPase [Aliivibrio fischeri]MUI64359.1 arsenical pump-driving ATPase [Aliivibrio fischeri]USR98175.1 arsenical pump-driving ATPase [Aliivibrio fischeri ATCC 7744 = JCM 18803 = DSM 507]